MTGSWGLVFVIEILSPFIVTGLILICLASRVAYRAGFSGWWAVLIVLPPINILLVWIFAFRKWPGLPQSDRMPPPDPSAP